MKKINFLFIAVFLIAIGTAFVSVTSSSSKNYKEETPTCCQKKGASCETLDPKNGSGELIMESMSRQFIAISPL